MPNRHQCQLPAPVPVRRSFYHSEISKVVLLLRNLAPVGLLYFSAPIAYGVLLSDNHDIISMKLYDVNVGHKVALFNIF